MEARPHRGRCPLWQVAAGLPLLLVLGSAMAQAPESACGPLQNAFGPFDYRTERGNSLELVESAHFPPHVEYLIRGHTTVHLGGDLDYTLRAFPNHHRALLSVMRYGERAKSPQPPHLRYTVECYIIRALRFRPDDTVVRLLYALYLHKSGRTQAVQHELQRATELAGDNGLTHYNIGLMYLEMKDYEHALRQAHKARSLGFGRTELRDRLAAVGRWRDAADEAASSPQADKPVRETQGHAPAPRPDPLR